MVIFLGKYIFLNVATEWLRLENLTLLDTSYCSSSCRSVFLNHLSSEGIVYKGYQSYVNIWPKSYVLFDGLVVFDQSSKDMLTWVSHRNLKMTSFNLTNEIIIQTSRKVDVSAVKSLFLSFTMDDLFEPVVSILRRCQKLQILHLDCKSLNQDLIASVVIAIAESCPDLVIFCIYGVRVSSSSVVLLSQRCPLLEEINVGLFLNDVGVDAITKHCRHLKRLKMGHARVTSLSMEYLTCRDVDINSLDVMGCGGHSDKPMMELLTARESKYISILVGNNEILSTSDLMRCIALTQRNITSLDFSYSWYIRDDDIVVLCDNCKLIINLTVSSCLYLTAASGVSIANGLPMLSHVHFGQNKSRITKGMMYFISRRFEQFHGIENKSSIVGLPHEGNLILDIEMLPPDIDSWCCYNDSNFLSKLKSLEVVVKLDLVYDHGRLNKFINCCGDNLRVLDLSSSVKWMDLAAGVNFELCFGFGPNTAKPLPHALRGAPNGTDLIDSNLEVIAAKCSLLERVNFSWNYHITDSGMIRLIKRNLRLTHVLCSHCGFLSDVTVIALAETCVYLLALDLQRCGNVTDVGLRRLAIGCQLLCNVNIVNIADNDAVTMLSVESFRENCKDMLNLYRSHDVQSWSSTLGLYYYEGSEF